MKEISLFAHRGYTNQKTIPENSLLSLDLAVSSHFKAVEFDIWFAKKPPLFADNKNFICPKEGEFELLIAHDLKPNYDFNDFAKFDQFLKYGNDLKYWLDFKNADKNNSKPIAKKVFDELRKHEISMKNVIIAPFNTDLQQVKVVLESFQEIFGDQLRFACVCDAKDQVVKIIDFMSKNQIHLLSINHEFLDRNSIDEFKNIDLLAWTVNSLSRMHDLIDLGVVNFATDLILNSELEQKSRMIEN